ncbi:MAG: aldehyde dehydrogenase family protein [Actinobacteria bacterium]|nr:aldehyde dehydrogenase family protein [Actinomycetota bacterium]
MSTSNDLHGTLTIPEGIQAIPASSRDELDAAVEAVGARKGDWVAVDVNERIRILQQLIHDTLEEAERWADAGTAAKGIDPESNFAGEEWLYGPALVVRNLRLLKRALQDIAEHGRPQLPGEPDTRHDGQVVAPVFPTDVIDRLLFLGFTAEVWMQPDVTLEGLPDSQAVIYQPGHHHDGKVALVLGAGNVGVIPPTDVLYKLFAEDQVVVLKMNPVNDYLGPILEDAFDALIDRGFLRIVYGGVDAGRYLTQHPGVDTLHITGSDKTHDAIVFGAGAEGRRNKQQRTPKLDKPITSELGSITPVIVVPGPWSDGDLAFHGENIASMLMGNAGFNCVTARLIITHRRWGKRGALLDAIRDVLERTTLRYPYYPGARERFERFVEAHPEAETYGEDGSEGVPWTFIPGVAPTDEDDIVFTMEPFAGIFAETALDAPPSIPDFLARATELCNDRLWGTLAASIIVHPRSLNDPAVADAVDRAVADLRYGTVVINHFTGVPFGMFSTPWGAYPGHELHDIQSGRGVVHNTYLFDQPQKSVVRGPFRVWPRPVWFANHRNAEATVRELTHVFADPSLHRLPKLMWEAAQG